MSVNRTRFVFEIHSGHGELMAQLDTFWWEGGQVQHNQSEPKRQRQRVAKRRQRGAASPPIPSVAHVAAPVLFEAGPVT